MQKIKAIVFKIMRFAGCLLLLGHGLLPPVSGTSRGVAGAGQVAGRAAVMGGATQRQGGGQTVALAAGRHPANRRARVNHNDENGEHETCRKLTEHKPNWPPNRPNVHDLITHRKNFWTLLQLFTPSSFIFIVCLKKKWLYFSTRAFVELFWSGRSFVAISLFLFFRLFLKKILISFSYFNHFFTWHDKKRKSCFIFMELISWEKIYDEKRSESWDSSSGKPLVYNAVLGWVPFDFFYPYRFCCLLPLSALACDK